MDHVGFLLAGFQTYCVIWARRLPLDRADLRPSVFSSSGYHFLSPLHGRIVIRWPALLGIGKLGHETFALVLH
jgi:hypothetical protein